MTARERVLASRLIQKIDNNEQYARQIGLSCAVAPVGINNSNKKSIQKKEKKNYFKGERIMKTAEDFIRGMERSNVLMSREYTFKEYVSDIVQFQDMVCKMISGDNYHEGMRIDEALFIMESTARKRELRSHPAVHNGVLTMKKLAKEMAITMSGAKGESLVSRTLEFLNRPNTQIFRNVYITDGIDETELDGIVLTDNGVIILEVKKVKSDLTLTEDGRMVFAGDECYDKVPLAQKMALKRRLLKKCLEKAVGDKGFDIPVYVDSFIVFSAPKGQFIKIDDRYRREKHCFRTGLNKKIESYIGCAYYKAEQLAQLGEIFSEMESNVKRFETELNYDEVRRSLAEALVVLQDTAEKQEATTMIVEKPETKQCTANVLELYVQRLNTTHQQAKRKATGFGYVAASVFACLLISGATVVLSAGVRRA